jgi:outer membrane protein assembly factor BamE (lipoprotein component of BamABCDE complex)
VSMYHTRAVALRYLSSVVAVSGIAMIAGCAAMVEQRGNLPTPEKLAEIQPGVTSKDGVIKILGSPSSVSIFNDKSWYYISRRTGQTAFFEPSVLDQQVYIVSFDDQGVVKTVDHKGVQDARAIDPVPRATPAPGRELTFLEQLIGNVGKFNNAGSTKSTGSSSGGGGPTGRPPS